MNPPTKEELVNAAFAFLSSQPMGIIATVAPDNTPQAASVNYFIDTDWTMYLVTHKDSRKVQNIKQNSHVAFVVGVAEVANTAQIQADATILDDADPEFTTAFQKLKDSKKLDRDPMYDIYSSNDVLLKLKITWLRWLFFDKSTGKPVYTVLIP